MLQIIVAPPKSAQSMNKKVIKFPCTPLVYRVLTARYGDEITVSSHSNKSLWEDLQKDPLTNFQKEKENLTKSVTLIITGKLAQGIHNRDWGSISLAIQRQYVRELYLWVTAQVDFKNTAYNSIQRWLEHHNIEDDDFAVGTAYRNYTRYASYLLAQKKVQKSRKGVSKNLSFSVLRNTCTLKDRYDHRKPNYYKLKKFLQVKLPDQQRDARTFAIYLYHTTFNMSHQQIAQREKMTRQGVRDHIRRMKEHLKKETLRAKRLYKITEILLNTTTAVLT
jgi:predicted DNA-binding protein YlxM (UPF0122 family)